MLTISFVALVIATAVGGVTIAPRSGPQTIPVYAQQAPGPVLTKRSLAAIDVPLTDYFNRTDLQ